MTTLSISRKPSGIYGRKSGATQNMPQQGDSLIKSNVCDTEKNAPETPATRKEAEYKKDSNKKYPRKHRKLTKQQRKTRNRIKRLAEMWPSLFGTENIRPLKVGIFDDMMQDIAARELTYGRGALKATLANLAHSPRYYRALVAGGPRYDLNGQPCGEVTPEEQQNARDALEALKAGRKETERERVDDNG